MLSAMRTAYHAEIARLTEHLGEMCGLAGVAMEHATEALLQADLVLAEQVLSHHDKIAAMSAAAEKNAFVLWALSTRRLPMTCGRSSAPSK